MQRNTPPDAGEQPRNVEARERDSGYGLVPSPSAPRVEESHPPHVALHRSARRHARHGTPWFAWMLGGCLGLVVVVVLFCAVLVGTLGGLAFRFASTQSASETKSMNWSVSGAPAIRVESDAADIHVRTGVDGEVHLAVALSAHAASEGDARDALRKITVSTGQIGNSVSIDAQTSQAVSLGVSLGMSLTVTAPRLTSVVVVLQSGNVAVDGVSGSISTSVHDGSVRLNGVSLTAASLVDVQHGDANISGTLRNGASLDLQVAAGNANVTLPKAIPLAVDAVTSAGNVTISGWAASPGRNGTGSWVHVDTATTHSIPLTPVCALSIHVQSGNITLQLT